MPGSTLLFITVICASGIEDIDDWGMRVCTTMDKLAQSYPEQYRALAKNSFAKLDDGSGVAVCHAVVPFAFDEAYTDALVDACGQEGSMGMCIACIDPDSPRDYMADLDRLRALDDGGNASGDDAAHVPELSWLTTVANGDGEDSRSRLATAYGLFIRFLDTQFDFAADVERYLASQRRPQN